MLVHGWPKFYVMWLLHVGSWVTEICALMLGCFYVYRGCMSNIVDNILGILVVWVT